MSQEPTIEDLRRAHIALSGGPPTWNMNMFQTPAHLRARGIEGAKVGDVVEVGSRVIVVVRA